MKRIAALLLVILFIPLCSCSIDFKKLTDGSLFGNKTKPNDPFKDKSVDIIPADVTEYLNELSCYNCLNDGQKKLYAIFLSAIENMELGVIDITEYAGSDGFSDSVIAHRALLYDRPDVFWMPKTFSVLSFADRNDKYVCFKDYYGEDDGIGYYGITREQRDQMREELDTAVEIILNGAKSYGSAYDKEVYFHDRICETVTYDSAAAKDIDNASRNTVSAYGALVERTALCEGYAKAMQLLCIKSGIPCTVVNGMHEGVPHMWNLINPGDGLYYLDVTFDDGSSVAILHSYLNVTRSDISDTHIFDCLFEQGKEYDSSESLNFYAPDCENRSLNYFEKNKAYIDGDCAYAILNIERAASKGKNCVELLNKTSLGLTDAFALLRGKAAGTVVLQEFYRYENTNTLLIVW
ncbi:MAG: hypothetical protein IKZ47_03355 [Clostridia bacterium]|nr:hypothetical protein [Clostridia bacterium]